MSARKLSTVSMSITRVPGVAIVLGALCITFGLMSPGFLTPANIANILNQSSILLLLALPMTVIIMTERLDLSTKTISNISQSVKEKLGVHRQAYITKLAVKHGLIEP